MKVRVKTEFLDKYTREPYAVGTILDLDDADRISDLVERELVTELEPAKVPEKPKRKTVKK